MVSTTLKYLLETFGPRVANDELAEVLKRSPNGLRVSLRSDSPFYNAVNATKVRYGRHVYYRSEELAKVLDDESFSE